jgi:hypothetical protein
MLGAIRSFLFPNRDAKCEGPVSVCDEAPPREIAAEGLVPFPVLEHLTLHQDLPILDWRAVSEWLEGTDSPELQGKAWAACERAWLLHLRQALGAGYCLTESQDAMLLSSLEENVANATLGYIDRTRERIARLLAGITAIPPWGKDLLIVVDDEATYYNYVSYYYPDEGEFAFSGGMHITAGCSHYVTVKADLQSIEPTIAHEMTHGLLSHLPLPLWLNEGIAVNTERRLARAARPAHSPEEMRRKHLSFWGPGEVQQFWSGESFDRTDDGNQLSYNLASVIVAQLAKDWDSFRQFVLAAHRDDGGDQAAKQHLGAALGELVCALLERETSPGWDPAPQTWWQQTEDGPSSELPPARTNPSLPADIW